MSNKDKWPIQVIRAQSFILLKYSDQQPKKPKVLIAWSKKRKLIWELQLVRLSQPERFPKMSKKNYLLFSELFVEMFHQLPNLVLSFSSCEQLLHLLCALQSFGCTSCCHCWTRQTPYMFFLIKKIVYIHVDLLAVFIASAGTLLCFSVRYIHLGVKPVEGACIASPTRSFT